MDLVYVHSPDRLDRCYAYQVLLLDEFSRYGTEVKSLNGPPGESAEDMLLVQVQGMISEYERAKIFERCRRGKLHKARQGFTSCLSGAPYGYMYVRKTDSEPARYEILLHEAKTEPRCPEEPDVLPQVRFCDEPGESNLPWLRATEHRIPKRLSDRATDFI
ncbi:MAG: recombinase family protein [Deltaproteobacteria bacterium]|nr:recombinase family protein [Deltaproteobacteria bacterium]